MEFEVLKGLGGTYTFYAVYVEEGKSPMTDSFMVLRSNIAIAEMMLNDR
ncbi:MAG: hypothetical protein GY862_10710 [Gammaproteobacteria bacterium]|nr:hypothetical protein [Gammaproteobacteria bacterium]